MASEESEGKPLQEKRLLCSKSFDSSTNKEDEFDNRKPTSGEMSKSIVQNENTVDICSLTEEQLHSLLEEATTFNRPKEQDSCILRALRKEIVESDPCGDVNTSDSSSSLSVAAATVATVASGHGCKRKGGIGGGRNVNACASAATGTVTAGPRGGFKNLNLQISDDSLMVNHQHHTTGLQGWTKSEINSCSSGSNRGSNRRWQQQQQNKGGSVASATVFKNNGGSELQSQSLQDLPSTRFGDPLVDSMRAAGVGRGNRRLHNATRANSFTYTGDGAEWLPLQTQVSALDGLRTSGSGVSGSGRSSKSKTKSKTTSNICNNSNNNNNNNNPQTVLTIEDDINLLEATKPLVGPKGWSSVTAPTCVAVAVASAAATSPGTGGGVVDNNNKTITTTTPTSVSPLTTFSCDNCEPSSEVSLLSCRPLKDDTEVLVEKSNINGGLGVIEPKNCGNGNDVNVGGGLGGVCVASSSTLLPNEIEMMELDKGKSQCLDLENRSTFVYNLEGNCQGGMDCRADVDSQVTFPLKPGRICSPANKSDILCTAVQSPAAHINGILPITGRSEAVKSIIGNDDSRKGEGNTCRAATEFDKLLGKKKVTVPHTWPDDLMFYPNVDFNGNPGNPLVRMPTTFLTQGYSFDSHQNLNKVDLCSGGTSSLSSRKAKRSKSNAEKETISKAEDVDGYCGQLGIDDLVEFINSTGNEKKKPGSGGGGTSGGSSSTKSGSGVTVNNNRNSGNTESCDVKRKDRLTSSTSLNRDNTSSKGKNGFKRKNAGSNVSSSGSSEEHNGPEPDRHHHHHNSAESDDGDLTPVRNASPISDKDTDVIKQDRSELILQDPPSHSVPTTTTTTRDVIATANYVTSTTSSIVSEHEVDKEFVEDFYAVAEIQAPLEESEFRVVVNKQRKRKQNKKSEPFRRHQGNGQNDRSGNNSSSERDFYLHSQQIYSGLTHRNQRGKPDPNRRKSTSSMPPSEPSSADNSDLDSVHSLPVVGSMPPNTGPHPHTTPSSMSSTPQASYADIARMASASNATVATTNVNYPPPTSVVSVPKKVEVVSPMETPHLPSSSSQVVPRQTTPPLNQQPVIDVLKDPFPKITETLPSPPVVAATVSVPSNTEKVVVVTTGKVHVSTSPMVSMPTSIAKPKPQIERELVTNVVVKEQVTTVVPVEPTKEQQQQPKQVENKDVAVIVADPVSTPLSSPDVVIDNNKRDPFSRGSSQDTVVVSPTAVKDSPSDCPPNPQPTTTTTTTTTSKSSSSGQVNNPPVILDTVGPNAVVASSSSSRGVDVCDVSFGFDLNELMKLSEGGVPVTFDFEPTATGQQAVVRCGVGVSGKDSMVGDTSSTSSSSDHPNLVENYVVVSSKTEQQSSSTITTTGPVGVEGTQGSTSRVLTTTAASTTTGSDVTTAESNRQLSSLVENVVVLNGGKRLKFKEKFEESAASFNHNEVANFLGFGWENVQDYQTSRSGRILYYNSSQC